MIETPTSGTREPAGTGPGRPSDDVAPVRTGSTAAWAVSDRGRSTRDAVPARVRWCVPALPAGRRHTLGIRVCLAYV